MSTKKINDLTKREVDVMVALIQGYKMERVQDLQMIRGTHERILIGKYDNPNQQQHSYSPTTMWNVGGPIIDKMTSYGRVSAAQYDVDYDDSICVVAEYNDALNRSFIYVGDDFLDASMRCFVASIYGDEIALPEGV